MTKKRLEKLDELLNEIMAVKSIKNVQIRIERLEKLDGIIEKELKGKTGLERFIIEKMEDEIVENCRKATDELLNSI